MSKPKDINPAGEFALWDQGIFLRYEKIDYVDGKKVLSSIKPKLVEMKAAAAIDGVILRLDAGLRTWGEQMFLRKQNVIDKTRTDDEQYLTNADSGLFNPRTGKPGWSNHHDGKAYDFNVTDPRTKKLLPSYAWLVKNAFRFGFVRTVPSETWHWENIKAKTMFDYVEKDHASWMGLV